MDCARGSNWTQLTIRWRLIRERASVWQRRGRSFTSTIFSYPAVLWMKTAYRSIAERKCYPGKPGDERRSIFTLLLEQRAGGDGNTLPIFLRIRDHGN